jgi:TorA maturation chaperone TorD
MAALAAPIALHRSLPAEEAARGDFYALLARLFLAPPDAAFLRNLASAPLIEGRGALGDAWRALVEASSAMDMDAAAEEYEALFDGVGRARVSLYAGHYSGAAAIDHPRVRIQADLTALGLARHDSVTEPEDHFAGLFEAMRVLVAGGAGRSPATLAEQRRFFEAHVEPGGARFCAAVCSAAESNYYRTVGAFAAAFLALESESFQLD